ncbi:PREDICTED: uncharacterized protein LOC108382606 [Rhagoletis zephyria]|uniref:uncharacterized protein LOC108382606 n=1 Tax=Rhagoletis zephyria TaxID=28612 RepID=UPI0008112557|nr:PREDICTED: uncharacterized protein LOC108382606 [Rhagoletis zephyria]
MVPSEQSTLASNLVSCLTHGQPMVLLATASVYAIGTSSIRRIARILCDPGSQVSFVTEKLANQLQLRRRKHNVAVEGIGAAAHTHTSGGAKLTLQSHSSDFALIINVLIIPSITSLTPGVPVATSSWKHLHGLPLADPHFGTPGPVDILLGADVWGLTVEAGIVRRPTDQPHAQRTSLGWVGFGPANGGSSTTHRPQSLHAKICDSEVSLEELVRYFWKWEELPSNTAVTEDDECEQFFAMTHTRTAEGRYVVQLPFHKSVDLGDSYTQALQQFLRIERRLAGDDELHSKYTDFMREYAALGHMERVANEERTAAEYYIPHHAVLAKFRVVFNASARTPTGVSLNDVLMVGPTIQDPLVHILFRFRLYRVALIADIEKMFRQVEVDAVHRNYQRILWRDTPTAPVGIYRLKTVTYGMACSPRSPPMCT